MGKHGNKQLHGRFTHLQGCELVEVGGKQRGAPNGGHEVLRDGPGQAEAVVGGGAAPQLVDDDQGLLARTLRMATLSNYIYCISLCADFMTYPNDIVLHGHLRCCC